MSQANTTARHDCDTLTGLLNEFRECGKMIGHNAQSTACQHATKAEVDELIQRKAMIRHSVESTVTHGCH